MGAVRGFRDLAMRIVVLLPFAFLAAGALGPILAAGPVQAQSTEEDLQRFNTLTRMAETFDIMRLEGLENDKSLAEDLFGNADDPTWARSLDKVYSLSRMSETYEAAMRDLLAKDPTLVADASVFLGSDLGQRIIGLELEARRTSLDPMAMGAAQEVYSEMQRTDTERLALIERLVVAADLIEGNVSTALNANVAFSRAMAAASAPGQAVDEEQLLANVWAQEADIRTQVAEFVYPLMTLAYSPLSTEDLTAYVDFFESDVGQRFNLVVMASFEPVMIDLSAHLGAEAGRLMSGQVL